MTRCGWSACSCASIGGSADGLRRQVARLRRQHGVDEQPVAARGRDAAGAGVRAGDQAELLEVGHHVADRRRRQLEAAGARQRARADRLAVGDVALDQGLQQGLGTLVKHRFFTRCTRPILPASRRGRCGVIPRMATRFRHAALVGKFNAEGIREELESVAAFLVARGLAVTLEEDTAAKTGIGALSAPARRRARRARATSPSSSAATAPCSASRRQLARHDTPLVGINQGRLGFITDIAARRLRDRARADPRRRLRRRGPHRCSRASVGRDGKTIFAELRAQRRHRQPRRDRRHGRAAHRDRRRVRRPAARRRPDRRLADRLDRVRAVGRRADPASGHRRLGAGADRAARPLEPADRACPTAARCRSRSSPAATPA